ncbi:caspase-2-like [Saccoglossus kowalevskii]
MEKHHKEILRRHRAKLAEEMTPKYVYPHLISNNIFKPFMIEDIEAAGSRFDQNNQLLTSLESRGKHAFETFVNALFESGQTDLAELLRPTGPIHEPRLVDPAAVPYQAGGPGYVAQATQQNNVHPVWPGPGPGLITKPITPSAPGKEVTDSDEVYRMKSKPRGLAFILNNKTFTNGMKKREGSDIDCRNLHHVFKQLGFEVHIKDDLIGKEIHRALDKFAEIDHTSYDCCVIALLSHGVNGAIYSTDGELLKVEDITSKFNGANCPSLRRKPKLFFIQACRGESFDRGYDAMDAGRVVSLEDGKEPARKSPRLEETESKLSPEQLVEKMLDMELDSTDAFATKQTVPSEGDMLLAYATVPGYVSWRNSERGSWFIQAITEVFLSKAHTEDLLSMLTMVCNSEKKPNLSKSCQNL